MELIQIRSPTTGASPQRCPGIDVARRGCDRPADLIRVIGNVAKA
jgi:hypothetical protein